MYSETIIIIINAIIRAIIILIRVMKLPIIDIVHCT